jgi:hypothetical protein
MATTPTDDPLVNSDRTVGVRWDLDQNTLQSLKREVLLFNQIAIPELDSRVPRAISSLSHLDGFVGNFDELFWLRDIGIIRDLPALLPDGDTARLLLAAIEAEMGPPDVMVTPDEQLQNEFFFSRLEESGRRPEVRRAVLSRMYSVYLFRDEGVNAFPILTTRRQIGNVFPSGTAPVLEVVLKSMPIPDDKTSWQDIIEFRNDPESMKRLRRLRVWVRKFAKDTHVTSLPEMKEEIEVLLDDYEEHMKIHGMKVNKSATETLLTVAGKVAEDIFKLKWGELAKLPFILKERKVSLLEAELKAPNRELAFISMTRSRFSSSSVT